MNKRRFGIIGEKIAQDYIRSKGYEVLEMNYYTKRGEIDIIAKQENCIIFFEVKTRTNLKFGTPAMAVNAIKRKHIKSVAKTFLYLNKLHGHDVRFDVIEVFINNGKCEINHIEGAIWRTCQKY